jgi:hypothetical protein
VGAAEVVFPLFGAPDRRDKAPALSKEQTETIEKAAQAFFAAGKDEQKNQRFDAALDRLLTEREDAVRRAVWRTYRAAPVHDEARKDFEQKQVRYQKHLSPYTIRKVGERPAEGWPLFIALHGGGGAPREINDSQWRIMQRYYRDQSSVAGYQYLALRAPNDSWNGFYDDYVPPLISALIRQFLLFGDINPDKVYLLGYSHGGYGAFFIGPKIPDRFAAVHSSAAAPTEGAISPRTLRNTRFTFMVGENDNAFGRRQRCVAFNEEIQKLKRASEDEYPVEMELMKGYGHGGLPDRDKIKQMYAFTRNPVPRHLTWDLTDSVVDHFFWLSVEKPAKHGSIDARVRDNHIEISTRNIKRVAVHLDGRSIDFAKPLRITLNGKEQTYTIKPSFRTLCEALLERGDPNLAFSCRLYLEAEGK